MGLGVQWTLGVDGTQAMSTLGAFQSKMKDVGNTARSELAQKLKTVFEVTAIEEAVRRTAQWAYEIQQTSKALGISAEALQALQLIAGKTGIPQDAVVGMFENIAKARDEALSGNQELQVSFNQLGVTLSDLQSLTKSELFGKMMSNMPSDITKANMVLRSGVKNITGATPENYINAIVAQLIASGGFSGYQSSNKKSGDIIGDDTTADLHATWANMLQNLKKAGIELTPIAQFFVNLVNTFVNGLLGLIDIVKGGFDLLEGKWSSAFERIVGTLANAGMALGKMIVNLVYFIPNLIYKIPGIGKLFKNKDQFGTGALNYINDQQDLMNNTYHFSKDTVQHGEGFGYSVGTALLLKDSNLAGDIKNMAKAKSKAITASDKFDVEVVGGEKDGVLKDEWAAEYNAKVVNKGGSIKDELAAEYNAKVVHPKYVKTSEIATMASTISTTSQAGLVHGLSPADVPPIIPNIGNFVNIGGGGNGNNPMLKMGGTFGSGFQSKLIRLTEQMVEFLGKITQYMSFMASPVNSNNNSHNDLPGIQ